MTIQPTHTEVSVLGTTGSTFLPLGGNANMVYGLHITPVLFISGDKAEASRGSTRGISPSDRRARIQANPVRAAALAEGRARLGKVLDHQNSGVRTLSSMRLAAKLSQSDLAEKMDMKQPNVARLERRPGDPSMTTLTKLATALGVSITEVIAAVQETNSRLTTEHE